MSPNFDIFSIEPNGEVLWKKVAATLDDAKAQAQELAGQAKHRVVIFDQRTGAKLVVDHKTCQGSGLKDSGS